MQAFFSTSNSASPRTLTNDCVYQSISYSCVGVTQTQECKHFSPMICRAEAYTFVVRYNPNDTIDSPGQLLPCSSLPAVIMDIGRIPELSSC